MDAGFGASLRYAGPLSVLNHLHIASEMGVLIKDGRALERLVDIDTVVFDKTGTLTHDRPVLSAITLFGDSQEDEVLSLAAAAEQHQDHPIARAIRAAAAARRLIVPPLEEAAVYPGRGLSVRACGRRITLGSRRLLEAEGITGIPAELSHAQEGSTVLVAIDGALAAILELTAAVRHEAMALVNDLHARGLKVVIISGDAVEPTRQLAVRLGIATFHAEILPEGKSTLIAQLRAEGRKVCFVGDGINDALALRAADVSISLRGAATVATDAASIVMMNSSLANLIGLLDLAGEFDRNMKTNTALTLVPGAILLFGVYFLGFGLIASNIFYNGSVVLGILNSMRPALKLRDFGDPALDGDTSALGTQ
jgi:Cu2+-exporting ATPase